MSLPLERRSLIQLLRPTRLLNILISQATGESCISYKKLMMYILRNLVRHKQIRIKTDMLSSITQEVIYKFCFQFINKPIYSQETIGLFGISIFDTNYYLYHYKDYFDKNGIQYNNIERLDQICCERINETTNFINIMFITNIQVLNFYGYDKNAFENKANGIFKKMINKGNYFIVLMDDNWECLQFNVEFVDMKLIKDNKFIEQNKGYYLFKKGSKEDGCGIAL